MPALRPGQVQPAPPPVSLHVLSQRPTAWALTSALCPLPATGAGPACVRVSAPSSAPRLVPRGYRLQPSNGTLIIIKDPAGPNSTPSPVAKTPRGRLSGGRPGCAPTACCPPGRIPEHPRFSVLVTQEPRRTSPFHPGPTRPAEHGLASRLPARTGGYAGVWKLPHTGGLPILEHQNPSPRDGARPRPVRLRPPVRQGTQAGARARARLTAPASRCLCALCGTSACLGPAVPLQAAPDPRLLLS